MHNHRKHTRIAYAILDLFFFLIVFLQISNQILTFNAQICLYKKNNLKNYKIAGTFCSMQIFSLTILFVLSTCTQDAKLNRLMQEKRTFTNSLSQVETELQRYETQLKTAVKTLQDAENDKKKKENLVSESKEKVRIAKKNLKDTEDKIYARECELRLQQNKK